MVNSRQKGEREVWRSVVGYEGIYEVSNMGRVRSIERTARFISKRGEEHKRKVRSRILSNTTNKISNRVSVMLSKEGHTKRMSVHRLVAMAFVKNNDPARKTEVNHIDENPRNNKADNLEWCDRKYNMTYGKMRAMYDSKKRPVIAYDGSKTTRYESIRESTDTGVSRRRIMYALKNGNKVDGIEWRYVDDKQ